jgi:hypothetical protein
MVFMATIGVHGDDRRRPLDLRRLIGFMVTLIGC